MTATAGGLQTRRDAWHELMILPWPPRALSPNARVHWRTKAKAVKDYRTAACALAKEAGIRFPGEGGIALRLDFHPPDKRKRDLDNMLASIKAAIDGIADAAGCNDMRFGFRLSREDPSPGGKIVVSVEGWRQAA